MKRTHSLTPVSTPECETVIQVPTALRKNDLWKRPTPLGDRPDYRNATSRGRSRRMSRHSRGHDSDSKLPIRAQSDSQVSQRVNKLHPRCYDNIQLGTLSGKEIARPGKVIASNSARITFMSSELSSFTCTCMRELLDDRSVLLQIIPFAHFRQISMVSLCLFSTRLKQNFVRCCFPRACVRVAGTHSDVLNRHTGACWDLHAVCFHVFFSACRSTQTRLAWMTGMGRMSTDFLYRQITLQISLPASRFFFVGRFAYRH